MFGQILEKNLRKILGKILKCIQILKKKKFEKNINFEKMWKKLKEFEKFEKYLTKKSLDKFGQK